MCCSLRRRGAGRSAFTLVELLVVIAIIGILVALLLSAVQAARAAARRTQCSNNLKQICLGMQTYADVHGVLPAAYYSTKGTLNPGWAWSTALLPQVEQGNLYDSLGAATTVFGGGANPALPTALQQTHLSVFRCPADTGPKLNPERLNFAMSNYRAVAGPLTFPTFTPDRDMGGVMWHNSSVSFAMITDGTSNTLAVGECMFDEKKGKRAAIWPGMSGVRSGSIWISDVMWWVDEATATVNGPAPQAFSSRHSAGAYFGFCDGSVRLFRTGGNPNVVKWLAGRNDAVLVNNDF